MGDLEQKVQKQLMAMQDLKYRDFQCKLMPTVASDTVIGVRTPELRKFAKEFSKKPDVDEFLKILPHKYYEENNLHGFLIETIKDYDRVITELDAFLPYVDNWATCDLMRPKIFQKHLEELLGKIKEWINDDHTYTIRFGIEMLMSFYLDEQFCPEFLELVSYVQSEEYYVNMMVAWYFATALAKQYDDTLPYIEQHRLSKWTHNKAIQKAVESYRISDGQKTYLRTLKVK
ncbi:MAG: DNA alkylation repair protein [Clostridiales bacterium]|nr:DNA alkylation repair protein [Clostridiales bacterium]